MYNVGVRPSYATGFAQWPGMSEYPELWQGLVGAWDMSLGITGSRVLDFSGNNSHLTLDTRAATYPTWDFTQYGSGVLNNHGDERLRTAVSDTIFPDATIGTVVLGIVRRSARPANPVWLNIENNTNNSAREMFWGCLGANAMRFIPNLDQDAAEYWEFGDYSVVLPLNEPVVLTAVWNRTYRLEGYRNGVLYGSHTGNNIWNAGAYVQSERFALGNAADNNNTTTNCNSTIYFALAYNRALSPSEIALISRLRKR